MEVTHDSHPNVDWERIERSPEFKELEARKRRFVLPATVFFLAWYFGFVALAGYAPDFMGESLIGGLTVGYALALSQFLMTWVLAGLYLRKADHEFDPLAERARALASQRVVERGTVAESATRAEEVQR
jgi:uncharacterized membrane protein (DUF485 family)